MNMPDGNTAALRQYEAEQDKGAALMEQAESQRGRLVAEYVADVNGKNGDHLQDCLTDSVAGDTAYLHGFQRIHAIAARPITPESSERITTIALGMLKRFVDYVDHIEGDDLVQDEASAIAEYVPCRCRGDCYC